MVNRHTRNETAAETLQYRSYSPPTGGEQLLQQIAHLLKGVNSVLNHNLQILTGSDVNTCSARKCSWQFD